MFLCVVALMLASDVSQLSAADYSPQIGRPLRSVELVIELAQQDRCCKHCTKGQPCENTCISTKAECKIAPGCAC